MTMGTNQFFLRFGLKTNLHDVPSKFFYFYSYQQTNTDVIEQGGGIAKWMEWHRKFFWKMRMLVISCSSAVLNNNNCVYITKAKNESISFDVILFCMKRRRQTLLLWWVERVKMLSRQPYKWRFNSFPDGSRFTTFDNDWSAAWINSMEWFTLWFTIWDATNGHYFLRTLSNPCEITSRKARSVLGRKYLCTKIFSHWMLVFGFFAAKVICATFDQFQDQPNAMMLYHWA